MTIARDSLLAAPASLPERYRLLAQFRALGRNRYQLAGAFVLAVLAPAAGIWSDTAPAARWNTFIGSLAAVLLGAFVLRKVAAHPNVNRASYALPAMAFAYAMVTLAFALLGVAYVAPQLIAGFIIGSAWFIIVGSIEQTLRRPRLLILPGTEPDKLTAIREADWIIASSPDAAPAGYNGVVADLRRTLDPAWERFLTATALAGIPAFHSKDIAESLTGRVEIEHLSENDLPALVPARIYERAKRFLDIAGALLALPVLVPVCALVALAIKLDDGGPVFFRQSRRGFRGATFAVLKFRTMRVGSEGEAFTERNDPRVTRMGRILRRWRLDELPQVWNVLRGEMSWIGPRPESLELADWYERQIPFYSYRHIVRPGITGWAAVHQGNVAQIEAATDKLQYDFYYIRHFSPWLDAIVFSKTLHTVLTGYGSR